MSRLVGWERDKRRDNYGQKQKAIIPDWELPKIMALHDNKSPNVQIALMYGVSSVTIGRKIKKAKKWIENGTFEKRTAKPQSWHNLR